MSDEASAERDPQAWLNKVNEDLLAIDNNLAAARTPWSIVAFHAQ